MWLVGCRLGYLFCSSCTVSLRERISFSHINLSSIFIHIFSRAHTRETQLYITIIYHSCFVYELLVWSNTKCETLLIGKIQGSHLDTNVIYWFISGNRRTMIITPSLFLGLLIIRDHRVSGNVSWSGRCYNTHEVNMGALSRQRGNIWKTKQIDIGT